MSKNFSSKEMSGEVNYVTPLLIILLAAGIWAGTQFIPAFYQKAQLNTDLSEIIISNRRMPDEEVVEKILTYLQSVKEVEVKAEDIVFVRSEATPNLVSLNVNYRRLIHIPFMDQAFRLSLSVENQQDFSMINSFN